MTTANISRASRKGPIVFGIGGAGCSILRAIHRRLDSQVTVCFANTDELSLASVPEAGSKVLRGKERLKGKGSNGNPLLGEDSAKDAGSEIEKLLQPASVAVFIAGFGGGSGSGATPYFVQKAVENGIFPVFACTTPLRFEGQKRSQVARSASTQGRGVISCQTCVQTTGCGTLAVDSQTPQREAFLYDSFDSIAGTVFNFIQTALRKLCRKI